MDGCLPNYVRIPRRSKKGQGRQELVLFLFRPGVKIRQRYYLYGDVPTTHILLVSATNSAQNHRLHIVKAWILKLGPSYKASATFK